MGNVKFGHVKGTQAQKLAPIVDAMLSEGESSPPPYGLTFLDASLSNTPNYYNCKGHIEFYGTDLSQIPALEAVLRSGGIYVSDRHPDAPESSSKKASAGGGGGSGGVQSRTVVVKDWKSQKEVSYLILHNMYACICCMMFHSM